MPNTLGSIPTAYLRHNPYSLDTAIRCANRQHIARLHNMLLAKMKMPARRCDAVDIPYAMDMQFTWLISNLSATPRGGKENPQLSQRPQRAGSPPSRTFPQCRWCGGGRCAGSGAMLRRPAARPIRTQRNGTLQAMRLSGRAPTPAARRPSRRGPSRSAPASGRARRPAPSPRRGRRAAPCRLCLVKSHLRKRARPSFGFQHASFSVSGAGTPLAS